MQLGIVGSGIRATSSSGFWKPGAKIEADCAPLMLQCNQWSKLTSCTSHHVNLELSSNIEVGVENFIGIIHQNPTRSSNWPGSVCPVLACCRSAEPSLGKVTNCCFPSSCRLSCFGDKLCSFTIEKTMKSDPRCCCTLSCTSFNHAT